MTSYRRGLDLVDLKFIECLYTLLCYIELTISICICMLIVSSMKHRIVQYFYGSEIAMNSPQLLLYSNKIASLYFIEVVSSILFVECWQ